MKSIFMRATMLVVLGVLTLQAAQAQTKSRLQTILERGTLRVGTTGDFNPMSIKDPATNSYKGFDIDAMEQLAKDLGVKVEFVSAEWATLVAGITADRYDIFSGASLNMARAKVVGFSAPYLEAGTMPLVQKASAAKFKTWNDINKKGVTVAVLLGTVFEEQARQHFPVATVKAIDREAGHRLSGGAGRARAGHHHQQHRGRHLDADLSATDHRGQHRRDAQQAAVRLSGAAKRSRVGEFCQQLGGPEEIRRLLRRARGEVARREVSG